MVRAQITTINGVECICDVLGNPVVWPPVGAIYASRDGQGPFAYMPGEEHLIPPKDNLAASPILLEDVRRQAIEHIDNIAESYRSHAVTLLPGQIAEYNYTENETRRFLANPTDTLDGYPYLKAEQNAQAANGVVLTAAQLVDLIAYEISTCRGFGALIKEPRRTAKIRVDNAESIEEIQYILDTINWPGGL